jgi:hypothetical protein
MTIECLSAAALRSLQAKVTKIGRERGTLKYTLPNSEVIVFDLLARESFKPEFDFKYFVHSGAYCTVSLGFTAKPYGRGTEVDLGDNVETTLPWLIFTETGVTGDVAAIGRLVIDNDQAATAQNWVGWGIESRYYSSAATAALYYEAESCSMIAASTAAGPAGASGGGSNVARNLSLTTSQAAQFVVGTSATAQTHIGVYRIFTRVYAPNTNTGIVSVGLQWKPYPQGQLISNPVVRVEDNSGTSLALQNQWAVLDLGLVTLPKVKKGTQGWIGWLSASSTVAGDDINFDWIALVPVEEGYGEAYTNGYSGSPLTSSTGVRSVEIRHDGPLSQDTAGSYWIAPDIYEGDYLLVPPSGLEARTLRVIARYGRHVPLRAGQGADPAVAGSFADVTSDVSARLFVTPRYLVVPEP